MAKLVSKTYGEALFETAMEKGQAEALELMQEIQTVSDVMEQNPDFDKLMKHPGIPKQDKIKIIHEVFGKRVSDNLTGFLEVVVSKERYKDLPAIFEYYISKVKEVSHIGVVFVTTAVELTAAQKKAVEKKILATTSYKNLETSYKVDASLIGGMIIRIGDRVVDSSIRSKLSELTKQLLQIQLG